MDLLSVIKALAALAFVLGLLLGGTWLLRKYGSRIGLKAGQVSQDLKVVEWRSLDMRRKLAVVRWGDKEHLVCLAPTGDMLIASRETPPPFTPISPATAVSASAKNESGQ
jgi:flagellar protein FliO/FliZ